MCYLEQSLLTMKSFDSSFWRKAIFLQALMSAADASRSEAVGTVRSGRSEPMCYLEHSLLTMKSFDSSFWRKAIFLQALMSDRFLLLVLELFVQSFARGYERLNNFV